MYAVGCLRRLTHMLSTLKCTRFAKRVLITLTAKQSKSTPVSTPAAKDKDYQGLLRDIESRIRDAQIRASLSVNRELIELYWDVGR